MCTDAWFLIPPLFPALPLDELKRWINIKRFSSEDNMMDGETTSPHTFSQEHKPQSSHLLNNLDYQAENTRSNIDK